MPPVFYEVIIRPNIREIKLARKDLATLYGFWVPVKLGEFVYDFFIKSVHGQKVRKRAVFEISGAQKGAKILCLRYEAFK